MFNIMHTNVDGAGYLKDGPYYSSPLLEWETLDEAREYADRCQESSDEDGNPWRYAYQIRDRHGNVRYRTTPAR